MRKVLFFTALFCLATAKLKAQTVPAAIVAQRIANKMKDTLNLTNVQRNKIYVLNILINTRKANIRQQYTNRDSIGYHLQRIENKRDSMYQTVLPSAKYLLYKQKKRNLISAN